MSNASSLPDKARMENTLPFRVDHLTHWCRVFTLVAVACVLLPLMNQPSHAAGNLTVDFEKDVATIFQERCIGCHQPGIRKGDISLASLADLAANEFVIPGDPDGSYLIELISGSDGEKPEMPQEGPPLSPEQVATIASWIKSGAEWPKDLVLREKPKADRSWWSLQPLDAGEISSQTSIDDFIRKRLADDQLSMNPVADRHVLIRRATFDLLGLPPTPAEVQAFVADKNPKAYEALIDRLLDSPHYGERWGRHWLDVVRFGESVGFEQNFLINELWPFRDYVIRSLNEDKPFDQFIREHIAGDVFGKDQPEIAVGSAFLVAGPYDSVGNQDAVQAAQIRANTLDEIIRATSEAFMGLTVGCARCHDHKFDAITQEDYYSMYSTFAGVRHGAVPLATAKARRKRVQALKPLNTRKAEIESAIEAIDQAVLKRANDRIDEFEEQWTRACVDRRGTEETITPVTAKFVRLLCDGTDANPKATTFRLDELEVWSTENEPRNVALSSEGATATGKARINEDFPGVYGPHLAIDGKTGERFLSASNSITIELAQATEIDRIVFSSARGEARPEHNIFGGFPAEYRIETSIDGETWSEVANGKTRQPANERHRTHRLRQAESTQDEAAQKRSLRRTLAKIRSDIAKIPPLPSVFIGTRNPSDAKGPFHVFVGGNPQKSGENVVPTSLSSLSGVTPTYKLEADASESERRATLAHWLTDTRNPLTARVLANRIWHYHFGTGIVDTPSDLGYMGGRPTHPRLLDFLATKLQKFEFRLKPMHRMIMLSHAYRQSSQYRKNAAKIDGDSRLLWRFPPRRLSAEEVRDGILQIAGKLQRTEVQSQPIPDGGPGFRLYRFMRDNVSTYTPLDKHGPETYRRAVYHQNARAMVVDLMTDFDQPDCTFSAPRRAETTTPLQALTMLNHSFTLDMAKALSQRLEAEAGASNTAKIHRAYQLCYSL